MEKAFSSCARMGAGRKTQTSNVCRIPPFSPNSVVNSVCGRNLGKYQLGGVIFGCKNGTMKECQSKKLFGLPAQHFSYVKNIDPGLPLFLFNYSDRKLHGIFEASSKGQMYIDPYAWTADCSERTKFPAQVQIRVRLQCHPLSEDKFGQVISDNYYHNNHFWFELDHRQTSKLMYLLASLAIAPGTPVPRCNTKWRTVSPSLPSHKTLKGGEAFETPESEIEHFTHSSRRKYSTEITSLHGDIQPLDIHPVEKEENEDWKNLIYMKLKELALARERQNLSLPDNVNDTDDEINMCSVEKGYLEVPSILEKEESSSPPFEDQYIIAQEVEELEAFKKIQTQKNWYLQQKLMKAALEIQHLKDRCTMLESAFDLPLTHVEKTVIQSSPELHLDPRESLLLIRGYDGESWLSVMDLYCLSQNVIKSIKLLSSAGSYVFIVQLNGELYVFGGGNGCVWHDTVESYGPILEKRTLWLSFNQKKESLAGVSLNKKIFAVGGDNGVDCFSKFQMLSVDIARWISRRSLLNKRFDLAAVELNGLLCATGGIDYFKYALGGFDGCKMVPSIEVFGPCLGAWMMGELMNCPRVEYFAAAIVKEPIYVIGGVKVSENIVDTFSEGTEMDYGNNDAENSD